MAFMSLASEIDVSDAYIRIDSVVTEHGAEEGSCIHIHT